jgi:hypothetical protein
MWDRVPLDLLDAVGQAAGEWDAAGGDTEQQHVISAVCPLKDLVGDPGQRSPDLGGLQDRFPVAKLRAAERTVSTCGTAPGGMRGRHAKNLLSRLTGRALKDSGQLHRTSRNQPDTRFCRRRL